MLWIPLFILSGVISPLIPCSILGPYQPGEFIFQCPIFLPFHTVHGVLKARILRWFAIPFSNGPHFVRTFHHGPCVLGRTLEESTHHLNCSQVCLLQRPFTFWDLPASIPCLPGGLPSLLLGSKEGEEAPYSEVLGSFHSWTMFGQSGVL